MTPHPSIDRPLTETERATADASDEMLAVITDPASTRREVVAQYARTVRRGTATSNWSAIHAAIVERWSRLDLLGIKREAWTLMRRDAG